MKEVFQLIVSSFESLDDKSSNSYSKRISILETVAKVRCCVVMLDLEFYGLILEMFRHFIMAIRDYHPKDVFTWMESIMSCVIEESEEISSDLLFCIFNAVRKDNKEVMPAARKLMEKVIETCADNLRPYVEIELSKKGVSLTDYKDMVNRLCMEISEETVVKSECIGASAVEVQMDASKSAGSLADRIQTARETPVAVVNSIEHLATGGCSDFVTGNGNAGSEVDTLLSSSMLQYPNLRNADKASETFTADPSAAIASETINVNPQIRDSNLDSEKEDEGKSKIEVMTHKNMVKRGRKTKAKKKPSELELAGKFTSALKQLDKKDICASPLQESSNEAAEHSSPKASENGDVPSKGISGESAEKSNECSKSKTVVSTSENHTLLDDKAITSDVGDLEEGADNPTVDASEAKAIVDTVEFPVERPNAPDDENLVEDTTIPSTDVVQVTGPTVDEPMVEVEAGTGESPEQSGVSSEDANEMEDEPSKIKDDNKRLGRGLGKATMRKHAAAQDNNKKSASKSVKDEDGLKGTPKTSTKRKRIEENKSESKDFGEDLVGSKIKVWWPADKRYYKGVIESFDSAKKKHKVLYIDGEVEHLVLQRQRWEVITHAENSDTEEESDQETPNIASGKRRKIKEVNGGTSSSRKRPPPSSKSKSASNKRGFKEEGKAKTGSVKKLGRLGADVSGKLRAERTVAEDAQYSVAKATRSSKRKALILDKGNKSATKSGKRRRRH
ncbi:hypothetical protein QQ045_017892 [Rhodiola kirilowii]